jgi:hypothetical protein
MFIRARHRLRGKLSPQPVRLLSEHHASPEARGRQRRRDTAKPAPCYQKIALVCPFHACPPIPFPFTSGPSDPYPVRIPRDGRLESLPVGIGQPVRYNQMIRFSGQAGEGSGLFLVGIEIVKRMHRVAANNLVFKFGWWGLTGALCALLGAAAAKAPVRGEDVPAAAKPGRPGG